MLLTKGYRFLLHQTATTKGDKREEIQIARKHRRRQVPVRDGPLLEYNCCNLDDIVPMQGGGPG